MWELAEEKSLSPRKEEGMFEDFGGIFRWTVDVEEMEELSLYDARVTVNWNIGTREQVLAATTYFPKSHEE